jgi:hypothetical protein
LRSPADASSEADAFCSLMLCVLFIYSRAWSGVAV